ncbi:PaaI family thioesterase [Microbispora triticiradicis]|uniref:PaaI family thioesterase n=2 Tax=Microbispora TaxID=2005 RepID=A0ABY3LNC2_9ACTN|nr:MULTISPECIES: PaaI family thioesterase [Microbispora]TLP54858.1 PaaI family thioesterase [Microbispora fusca]TYB43141.1 PaaI family thioesterase [Microbispora tritici]
MAERIRTISWADPELAGQATFTMRGLEAVRAMFRGELPKPPMGELLGFAGELAEEGRAVLSVVPAEYHSNNAGTAHGGLAGALMDAALTTAVLTVLPENHYVNTLQLSLHYVRPLLIDGGKVLAEGTVVHRGNTITTASAEIRTADARLCVHGTGTFMIRRFRRD